MYFRKIFNQKSRIGSLCWFILQGEMNKTFGWKIIKSYSNLAMEWGKKSSNHVTKNIEFWNISPVSQAGYQFSFSWSKFDVKTQKSMWPNTYSNTLIDENVWRIWHFRLIGIFTHGLQNFEILNRTFFFVATESSFSKWIEKKFLTITTHCHLNWYSSVHDRGLKNSRCLLKVGLKD